MLIDRFGRIHDYLRLSLTESCNYRCVYCLPEAETETDASELVLDHAQVVQPESSKRASDAHAPVQDFSLPVLPQAAQVVAANSQPILRSPRMSADEIFRLAEIFVREGVRKIRLTGGEPLLRSDAHAIIQKLSKLPVELCLSTNASLIHLYIDRILSVGMRSVNISLDSLKPEVFHKLCGVDDFYQVRSNIDLLLEHKLRVKINMVVLRGYNDEEIVDFVRWTQRMPIEVRFIEFMPFPSNQWRPEKLLRTDEIISLIQTKFPTMEKSADAPHDTTRKYQIPGFAGSFAFISTMSHPFCSDCNRLRLSADGKMRNCLFASGEVDLARALRNNEDVGVLIKESLAAKAEKLGGHFADDWERDRTRASERSMMSIGG